MNDIAAEIPSIYEEMAAAWDDRRGGSTLERGWLGAFAALLPEGAEVLDLGCGTGRPVAQHLIAQGCRITGIDVARGMIERARANFPAHRWEVCDMRDLPPLGRFDGIVAWHSSFHLPAEDQRMLLDGMGALSKPGTALMFTSGPAEGEAIGEMAGRPLYHASLSPGDYEKHLEAQGFEVVRHVAEDPECGGATVWLARRTG